MWGKAKAWLSLYPPSPFTESLLYIVDTFADFKMILKNALKTLVIVSSITRLARCCLIVCNVLFSVRPALLTRWLHFCEMVAIACYANFIESPSQKCLPGSVVRGFSSISSRNRESRRCVVVRSESVSVKSVPRREALLLSSLPLVWNSREVCMYVTLKQISQIVDSAAWCCRHSACRHRRRIVAEIWEKKT